MNKDERELLIKQYEAAWHENRLKELEKEHEGGLRGQEKAHEMHGL